MRKSFTRLLSLVMLFTLLSSVVMSAVGGDATKLWPNDAGGVAYTKTTDKIMVIYPQAVQASTGSVRLLKGATLVGIIPASDSRISYAKGDTVVIDVTSYMEELAVYTVNIDPSTFKTVATTPVAKSAEAWSFTVGDYTAPTLKEVAPVAGTVVSSSSINLVLTFEDKDAVASGTGKVALYKADGHLWDLIDVATQGTLSGSVLTLTGVRALEDNVNYHVTIDAGVVTDLGKRADAKKNAYVGLTNRATWTFSTQDFSAPGYATDYPKKGTITNTSAAVLIKTTEVGTSYAVISTSAVAPTAAVIKADGTKKTVAIAAVGTEYSANFTGLSEATQYYIHLFTENVDGVAGAVQTVNPKTSETVAPLLSALKYYKGSTEKAAATVAGSFVTLVSSVTPVTPIGLVVDQTIDNIILDFNEEVKIGAGNVIIYKASDNSAFKTIAASSLVIQTDKSMVKIPVSGLENNAKYYVNIPNTVITDVFANKFAGISTTNDWLFTTTDIVGPTFTYTPVEGASNVKKNANIVLTFNELIYPNTTLGYTFGTAFTVKVDGTSVGYAVTSSDNDGKFTTLTINPTVDFLSSSVVTVEIFASSLQDVGKNGVDPQGQGIAFVVEDYVAPVVTLISTPMVPSDKQVIEFDEAVYFLGGGEITDANLYTILTVKKTNSNGENVPYTATINAAKDKITITPATPWASESVYYVAVSSALEDKTGNDYAGGIINNTFLISDATSASVDLSSVDGKTIATTAPVTLIFKEGTAVEARGSVYYNGIWNAYVAAADLQNVIVLKEGSATGPNIGFTVTNTGTVIDPITLLPVPDKATFAINATLEGNKTYYLGINASTKGTDGNVNAAKFVTFNTKFEGAVTISSRVPADNATEIANDANFVLTFNTDVEKAAPIGAGQLTISDGGPLVDITDAEVTVSGKVVTINRTADLATDKSYDIVAAAGLFKNVNSALASPAIVSGAWNFKTKDTQVNAPSFAPVGPGVAIDAKLVITFTEKVSKNLGYIDIKDFNSDVLIERIDVVSSQVSVSSDQLTVTITPSALFKYNTMYYAEVSAQSFQDGVGNKTAAIFGKTNWMFGTANPALAIVKTTPKDATDKIANDATLVIEFNREIVAGTGEVGYIEWDGVNQQIQSYPFGSTNVSISGKTLTILHPNKVFPANTEIFFYLPTGVILAATDAAIVNPLLNRTSLPSPFSPALDGPISFNTGDVNPPVPTFNPVAFNSLSPVYTGVDQDIVITFDEDIFNFTSGTSITNADVTATILPMFTIKDAALNVVNFAGSISGKTVTLNPTSSLAQFTDFTVQVEANKIKDALGHAITAPIASTFRTEDKTAPVVAVTLAGGDKKVTLSGITSNDPNNNKFYYLLRVKSDAVAPTAAEIKAANNKAITGTPAGTVSTFDISSLVASTTYQLYYVADDKMGNTSAVAVLEASTFDTVAPTLVSTTPATGAMDVNVAPYGLPSLLGDVVIKLTFSENVQAGAGAITVRDYATQGLLYTLSAANLSAVTPADAKSLNLTIPNVPAFAAPVKMYVEIAAGTIKDMATSPNNFAGILGMDALAFTTEDNAVPTVVAGTTGAVNLDANIEVEFSENVKAGNGNLVLYKTAVATANAVQVFTAAEAVFSGKKATVNPSANLENGVTYIVSVEPGFAKDLSSNANPNALDNTVTFIGSMNVKPFINSYSPAGGSTALVKTLLTDIHVVFNENIYLNVAGYSKSLALLTQAELLAHISIKTAAGTPVAINTIEKWSADHFHILTDASKFTDEAGYIVTISGFEDITGLVMDDYVANYTTSDGTAPIITFAPVYKATGVTPASNLTMTFSENFYADAVNPNLNIFTYVDNLNVMNFVYLREGSNTGTDVPFTASVAGKVITIDPTADLKSGVKYYYGMLLSVEDINGTVIPLGTEEKTYVYFNAADVTAPEMTAITGANYAPLGAGIAANAAMSVIFNEDVVVSTGSVVIRREDGTIFQTVSGAGLTIDGTNKKKLKIAHDNFEPFTNYFVEIGASAVVDKSGNANALFNDPTPANGWLFTTSDTYALTATVTPNGDNKPNVVNLEVMLNKAALGQANKYLAVYKADGTAVHQIEATSMLPVSGKTAVFANVALQPNQAYYAQVEPDAFKDASGNAFAGIMDKTTWVFSTVNNIAPQLATVAALSPANNSTNVAQATDLSITFDRPVAKGTGTITVRNKVTGAVFTQVDVANTTINGSVLTIVLPVALEKNVSYYVLVPAGAVTNTEVTKDAFAGIINTYDWTFTTGSDEVAPTFVSGTPAGTTNLKPAEVSLVGTFSEKVVAGTGNLVIYNAADDTKVETIAVVASMVSGDKLTVVPTALAVSKSYYILVDAGAVKDAVGNSFAGIADKAVWKFSMGDYSAPTVEVTAPAVPVATVFNIGLKFSEPVTGVLGGITVTGGKIEEITGLGADYTVTVSAKEQTEVKVVLSDLIKDMSPNTNKLVPQTLTYTTGDFTKPQLVAWAPSQDETTANNHPTFTMSFDEIVKAGAGNLVVYKVATTTPVLTIPVTAAMINGKDVTVSYVYDAVKGGLDKNTRYYVLVDGSALKDAAGNAFDGVSSVTAWTFKTGANFVTGIEPINSSLEFKVYPNPFVDYVTVANASKLSKIVVTNIAGQTVKVVVNPTDVIQLNELRSGAYFISLYDMDNVIAKTVKAIKR